MSKCPEAGVRERLARDLQGGAGLVGVGAGAGILVLRDGVLRDGGLHALEAGLGVGELRLSVRDLVGVVAVVEAGEDLAGLDLLAAGDGEFDDAAAHLEREVNACVGGDDTGEVQRCQGLRGADDH